MIRILLLALLVNSIDPVEIAKVNRLKKVAEEAFVEGDYESAIQRYHILLDSMGLEDEQIKLNLAHSYFQLNDTSRARSLYSEVSMSGNNEIKSIAYQQLGVMAKSPESLKESLQYLKASLKADPSNDEARYDYEVVKKLLDQQEKQNQNKDQQNQDKNEEQNKEDQEKQEQNQEQQNKDQQNQEQKDQKNQEQQNQEQQEKEGDKKEQEQQKEQQGEEEKNKDQQQMGTKEKLEEMNISEEKARMILEAMKNAEIQYLQQQKRKPTKKPDSGKPDW